MNCKAVQLGGFAMQLLEPAACIESCDASAYAFMASLRKRLHP